MCVAMTVWALVFGQSYGFLAWLSPLKARFDLTETEALAIGTSLYCGWFVGFPVGGHFCALVNRWIPKAHVAVALVHALATVLSVSAYVILFCLLTVIEDHATGAALAIMASAFTTIGCAIGLGAYFGKLLVMIDAQWVSMIAGIVYASYALGGVIACAISSPLPSSSLPVVMAVNIGLVGVVGVGTNVVMARALRKHLAWSETALLGEAARTEATPTGNRTRMRIINGDVDDEAGHNHEDDCALADDDEPAAATTRIDVVMAYVKKPAGAAVVSTMFFKCMVGPVLTTQVGIMFKSVSNYTEAEVIMALMVAQFVGRLVPTAFGKRAAVFGVDMVAVHNLMYTFLFVVASLLGAVWLCEQ